MSSNTLIIATSALVGLALAEDKSLSTLPLAAQFIAVMLTSIPASLWMNHVGRKAGFLTATLFAFAGAATATIAIIQKDFWLFVLATTLIGVFNGFGIYYRFAAADAVDEAHKSRAISYVLVGGVLAAIIGPNLASHTKWLIDSAPFAASYASLIIVYLVSLLALTFLKLPASEVHLDRLQAKARPLSHIASQPKFIVALICAMLGYGVMSLVMTATPLAMHHHAHSFDDTAFVIQWHVLGMFVPSFFTGHLIRRFGIVRILFAGALFGIACVVVNLNGTSYWHFWVALVLLGISWNFLFIGGTTLLTETYRPEERAKTQAANDFLVYTTITISSLSAGALQHHLGWQAVNMGVIPLLVIILASIVWLSSRQTVTQG